MNACVFLKDGAELLHVVRAKWCRYVLGSPEIFPRTDFLNNYFPCMADGVFLVQDEQHSFQKSLLHGAFSESHLENYVTIFEKHTQKLLAVSNIHSNARIMSSRKYMI